MFAIPAAIKWIAIVGAIVSVLGTAFGIVKYIEHKAVLKAQNKALVELMQRQARTVKEKAVIDDHAHKLTPEEAIECAVKGVDDPACPLSKVK